MSRDSSSLGNLLKLIALMLVAAAVYQELRKPAEEREWHGKVLSFVPYDFRMPTAERLRERLWNPDDPRIITEHFFGVGWSVNFYALLERLQLLDRLQLRTEPGPEAPLDTSETG